MGSTEISNIH